MCGGPAAQRRATITPRPHAEWCDSRRARRRSALAGRRRLTPGREDTHHLGLALPGARRRQHPGLAQQPLGVVDEADQGVAALLLPVVVSVLPELFRQLDFEDVPARDL